MVSWISSDYFWIANTISDTHNIAPFSRRRKVILDFDFRFPRILPRSARSHDASPVTPGSRYLVHDHHYWFTRRRCRLDAGHARWWQFILILVVVAIASEYRSRGFHCSRLWSSSWRNLSPDRTALVALASAVLSRTSTCQTTQGMNSVCVKLSACF